MVAMRHEGPSAMEHRISLTRVCLRSGSVVLPLAARPTFQDRAEIEAVDLERNESHILEVRPKGRLGGLELFFETHGLAVNDTLILRPLEDGRVALLARANPRSPRRDVHAVRRAVESLLAGGPPRSVEELRHEHGLTEDAPLTAALEGEPRLMRRAGRWRLRESQTSFDVRSESGTTRVTPAPRSGPAVRDATLNSAREDTGSREGMSRAREIFRTLGYEVTGGPGGILRLTTSSGRRHQHIVVRVLGEGERPDWASLLRSLRDAGAKGLAILGDVRDLHPLERPARGARATLWSWDGLARIESLRMRIPIGPVDLAPAFDSGGMYGAGIERFEAGIAGRLQDRAAFSDVLTRLADLRAPSVFSVGELGLDETVPRETVVRVLDSLSLPPFQWTVHVAPGEFALRHGVPEGLDQLAAYARSLRERLPDRRRAQVRGSAGSSTPELLGPDELAYPSDPRALPLDIEGEGV